MKKVKSLEGASLLIKDFSETVENEVKEQKGGFSGMLAATGCQFIRKYVSKQRSNNSR